MLPDGLSNYQAKQWAERFQDLKKAMLLFGFSDEVSGLSSFNTT